MRFSILVVLAGLLVLGGCDNSHDADRNQQSGENDTPRHTQPTQPVGKLQSHVEKLEKTVAGCQGAACPKVAITWEVFDGQPALNDAIRHRLVGQLSSNRDSGEPAPTTLKGAAKAFLAITDGLPDGAGEDWQLTGEAKRLDRRGNLLTVAISSYEFTGGAHGLPATHWLNWDLGDNKAVPLSAVIKPGQNKAFWDLARQAHDQWLSDEANADDDFRKAWPFQKTSDYRLSAAGVELLYGVYTIGPYVMGEPQLTLPWDQAKAVIRERYQPRK